MSAAPELVAIALHPVALPGAVTTYNLSSSSGLDPGLRQNLPISPPPLVQIQLAESCEILGFNAQPIATRGDPLRRFLPGRVLDSERIEKTRLQIIDELHTRCLLYNR